MRPERRIHSGGIVAITCVIASCAGEPHADGTAWRGGVEQLGDTTIVRNVDGALWGARSPVVADSVEVLWRSDDLEQPGAMAALDEERILVADRYRIHVLSAGRGHVRTIGTRSGEGPGEFARIGAVGVTGDTILVYDLRTHRLSYVDAAGTYLDGRLLTLHPEFVNLQPDLQLRPHDGAVIIPAGPNIDISGAPVPGALLRYALDGGEATVLRTVDGPAWKLAGDFVMERELFGPRAHFAVGPGGRVAWGDGVEYCVMIEDPADGRRRMCRTWTRVAVTDAVRDPPISEIARRVDFPADRQEVLRMALREQAIASHRPSYDRLMIDDLSRLWVRTIDEGQAAVHPTLLRRYAELRPSHFVWDVYARDGRRLGEVRLPSRFDPRTITARAVYGAYELETGEIAVARVMLPADLPVP